MTEEGENVSKSRAVFNRGRDWTVASDTRLIFVLIVALGILYVWLSLMGGFRGDGLLNRLQTVAFFATLFAMLALALNLQWGYAGLANLGIAGFMAVGVYTMSLLSMPPDAAVPGLGLPVVIGVVGGVLAATFVGGLAAIPALRLRADYLAIVTLAFGEIIRRVVRSRQLEEFDLFGRTVGLGGVRGPNLPTDPVELLLGTVVGDVLFSLTDALDLRQTVVEGVVYVVMLAVVTVMMYWMLVRVANSPFGRVLKAIREDELVASSLGKDVRVFKVKAFALGCGLMGLIAILWFWQRGGVSPGTLEPELTFFIFVALILGGSGSNTGAVVGGIVFAALLWEGPNAVQRVIQNQVQRPRRPDTVFDAFRGLIEGDIGPFVGHFFADVNLTALQMIALGVVLVYMMQNRPDGLLGHRVEVASSVDLTERPEQSRDGDPQRVQTDAGEEQGPTGTNPDGNEANPDGNDAGSVGSESDVDGSESDADGSETDSFGDSEKAGEVSDDVESDDSRGDRS